LTNDKLLASLVGGSGIPVKKHGISGLPTIDFDGIEASGGDESTDGDYKIHKFLSSGNFQVTKIGDSPNDELEYLLVASGGGSSSGGGGAGGYLSVTDYEVTVQTYAVVIGAGGVAGASATAQAGDGANAIITPASGSVITAVGGGGGGMSDVGTSALDGRDGGSGGGAGVAGGGVTGSIGIGSQGYNGGAGTSNSPPGIYGAGAGGGSGEVGESASATQASGGDGLENDIIESGTNIFYGGGGGAFFHPSQDTGGGQGGQGGGGKGGVDQTQGTDGLGGGGGGSNGLASAPYPGTIGGTGVCIFRYKYK